MSALEDYTFILLQSQGLEPVREYLFARERKRRWRFDFAWPAQKVALEVEGGTYGRKSRHTTGKGFAEDCKKYNAAAVLGWVVLRVTSDMINDDPLEFIEQLKTLLDKCIHMGYD